MSLSHTCSVLWKLFVEIAHQELSIDLHRQSLWQEFGFHPLKAFFRIKDIRNRYQSENVAKDYIDAHDLDEFLHNNYHDDVKLSEWSNIINYFDSNNGARFYFEDFLLILLPCQDRELRNVIKRAKYDMGEINPNEKILYQDCEILLASLFKREIDLIRMKNQILEDLDSISQCSPLDLFNLVDTTGKTYLDHLNLKEFVLSNGHYTTDDELIAIIRRIDTDGDSKINYSDFIQFT